MGSTSTEKFPIIGRRSWTLEEFERLADIGFFGADERLELLFGEIVPKITQNEPHAIAVRLAEILLNEIFRPGSGHDVRCQSPMNLELDSRPEPDLAVVPGSVRDYLLAHPSTAVLVIEVSNSALQQDRGTKSSIYARAGIQEYWIINLVDRVVEVRRQPAQMPSALRGYAYASVQSHGPGASISPLAAPQAAVRVDDLLP